MFVYAMANLGFFLFACETMIFSLIAEPPEFYCRDQTFLDSSNLQNINSTFGKDVCEYTISETNTSKFCRNFEYPGGKDATLNSGVSSFNERRRSVLVLDKRRIPETRKMEIEYRNGFRFEISKTLCFSVFFCFRLETFSAFRFRRGNIFKNHDFNFKNFSST